MIHRVLLAAILFLSVKIESASAQAWTRNAGDFYINANYRLHNATSYFAPNFETEPLGTRYTQHTLGVYGEIGLIDRWLTLSLAGEAFRQNRLSGMGATQGLGDFQVGLWTGLLTAPFHLAAGVIVGIPSGDESPSAGPTGDPQAQAIAQSLPTGDGETDVALRLAAGHSFGGSERYPLEHYALLELGAWFRSRGIHHGMTYRAELGTRLPWTFIRQFLFIFRIQGQVSFLGSDSAAGAFVGLGDGVSFTAYGFEAYIDLTHGFSLGIGRDSAFRARNITAGSVYKFSLSYEHRFM